MQKNKGNIKYDFSGKYIVVTGATKGIGRDILTSFASAGAVVGAVGRNERELEEVADEIVQAGGECVTCRADLCLAEDCLNMADFFIKKFPRIDILVNNAGISFPERIENIDIEHWDTTLNVNLRAPMILTREFSRGMIERKAGVIINVSSNACIAGINEHSAYCASKFGLNGLTKVMAVELGPYNIRVNAIAPTVVLTPMGTQVWGDAAKAAPVKAKIPLGRFVYPKEVSSIVMFLASDEASMIHGETVLIDGGANAKLY